MEIKTCKHETPLSQFCLACSVDSAERVSDRTASAGWFSNINEGKNMKNPFRKESVGVSVCGSAATIQEFKNGWLLLFLSGCVALGFVLLLWEITGGWCVK